MYSYLFRSLSQLFSQHFEIVCSDEKYFYISLNLQVLITRWICYLDGVIKSFIIPASSNSYKRSNKGLEF